MEQLDQLKTMRDQAAERLEAARAALEQSPDAKLVSSLSSLIEELETSLGLAPEAASAEEASAEEATAEEAAPEEVQAVEEEPNPIMDKIEAAAKNASAPADEGEFSLEESLEAELLSGDDTAGEHDKTKDA